jgi:hypothetical protein
MIEFFCKSDQIGMILRAIITFSREMAQVLELQSGIQLVFLGI